MPGTGSVSVALQDLILFMISETTGMTTVGVTDNLGNTYASPNAYEGGNLSSVLYYSVVTIAGTLTTINANTTASTRDAAVSAAVIEGPFAASGALDVATAWATGDTASPYPCPASGVLAQADELVVACGGRYLGRALVATSPNLLAIGTFSGTTDGQSGSVLAAIGYQVVASTSSVTPEFTGSGITSESTFATFSFKKELPGQPAAKRMGNIPHASRIRGRGNNKMWREALSGLLVPDNRLIGVRA